MVMAELTGMDNLSVLRGLSKVTLIFPRHIESERWEYKPTFGDTVRYEFSKEEAPSNDKN